MFESYRDCDEEFMRNFVSSFDPPDLVPVWLTQSFEDVTSKITMRHLGKTVSRYNTVTSWPQATALLCPMETCLTAPNSPTVPCPALQLTRILNIFMKHLNLLMFPPFLWPSAARCLWPGLTSLSSAWSASSLRWGAPWGCGWGWAWSRSWSWSSTHSFTKQPTVHSEVVSWGRVCGCGCWRYWQVTGDMQHVTCDILHMTCDTSNFFWGGFFCLFLSGLSVILYPHVLSVSPVCRIFI